MNHPVEHELARLPRVLAQRARMVGATRRAGAAVNQPVANKYEHPSLPRVLAQSGMQVPLEIGQVLP